MSKYGYCPECDSPVVGRQAKPDGSAMLTCTNGHTYPSEQSVFHVNDISNKETTGTQVICRSIDCKHNLSHDPCFLVAECRMKSVYLLEGGRCEQYEKHQSMEPKQRSDS
jgi:hypothetical protein